MGMDLSIGTGTVYSITGTVPGTGIGRNVCKLHTVLEISVTNFDSFCCTKFFVYHALKS